MEGLAMEQDPELAYAWSIAEDRNERICELLEEIITLKRLHYGLEPFGNKPDNKADLGTKTIWRRCENVLQKLKNEAAIDVDNIGSDYHMGRCEALGDALDAITAENYRTIAFDCAARRQGTGGGNDPADCGWPNCGCG